MRYLVLVFVLLLSCTAVMAGGTFESIKADGCRNIWVSVEDASAVQRLSDYGFNAVTTSTWLLKDSGPSSCKPDDPSILLESDVPQAKLDMVRRQAKECARLGMLYMPYINQLAGDEVRLLEGKNYRHVVNHLGVEGGISPCPLERKDWFGFQLPQMLSLARILAEEGCEGGVMFEAEAYCATDLYPGYHTQRQSICYCDHCWDLFLKKLSADKRPEGKLQPAERYPWLSTKGLLWQYEQSEREELVKLLKELTAEVRKVKPDCIFGIYPYSITWYSDAIVQGLGSPQLPILIYSAEEYYSGYKHRVVTAEDWSNSFCSVDQMRHLKDLKADYLYLGGLVVGMYWPHRLGLEMTQMLRRTDGFWLYWGGTLLEEDSKANIQPEGRTEWSVREQPSLYWPKITAANKATNKAMKPTQPAGTVSRIKVWNDMTFKGPEGSATVWDIANPPTFDAKDRQSPRVDRKKKAIVVDLSRTTDQPKAMTIDHSFVQQPGVQYIFAVNAKYEGNSCGARMGLGWSYPGFVEEDGRQIYGSTNFLLRPQDGWVWQVRSIRASEKEQPGWLKLSAQANPGRVYVRSLFFAPCKVETLESPVLQLAEKQAWGRIRWDVNGAHRSIIRVDILDGDTGRELYADVPNGFDLGDISRIYGLQTIKIRLNSFVPAGDEMLLRSLVIENGISGTVRSQNREKSDSLAKET